MAFEILQTSKFPASPHLSSFPEGKIHMAKKTTIAKLRACVTVQLTMEDMERLERIEAFFGGMNSTLRQMATQAGGSDICIDSIIATLELPVWELTDFYQELKRRPIASKEGAA